MCAGSPTAGSSSSFLSRPDNEFETDSFEDLFLRDEPVVVINQVSQQIEGLWREQDALVPAPQAVVGRVESERVELLHCARLADRPHPWTRFIVIRASLRSRKQDRSGTFPSRLPPPQFIS